MSRDPSGSEALQRGDAIGRYLVLESLGAGGIGTVYRAYDPDLDRAVALKRLRADLGDSEARRARVFREAQAMARLTHQNVVAVYDVLDDERGLFIAMELVEGEDLDRWLERPRKLEAILDVFIDCAAGLAAAHRANVCHRDCKPSNFLVTRQGLGKVADFGLAAPAAVSERVPVGRRDRMVAVGRLSADGAVPGTADYVAPEVVAGGPADPRSDQYSFCVALREALRRGRPEAAVPGAVRRLLRRGLDPDPARRFADMEELGAALTAARGRSAAIATRLGIAFGVVATAIVIGVFARTGPAACPDDEARWAGIWDAPTRHEVEAAVAGADLPNADAVSARLLAALDDYTVRWSEGYGRACAETGVSEAVHHARSLCYELRREQVRALVELVMAPEPSMASALADPLHALEPLEPCATAQPTQTPGLDRLAASELDTALADVAALRWAGQLESALQRAREAVDTADDGKDAVARSAARLELGLTLMDAGEYEPAIEALTGAYWLAETQGDARKAARAASAVVMVLGSYLEQPERADAWVPAAEAAVAALDSPGDVAFGLDNALGTLAQKRGDYDNALRHYERAAATAVADPEITAATAAIVLQNLATTLERMGRWDDAEARYQEARAALEREHGAMHPSLGLVWHNVAIFNHTRGRWEAAVAAARRALQVKEATLPPQHFSIAVTLHALGTILQDGGEVEEAEAVLLRAEAIIEATVGRDHPLRGALLVNLADLASDRGELDFAERRFDEAIAALRRTYGASHDLVLQARAHRAMLWSRQGKGVEALAELETVRDGIAQVQGPDAVALLHIDLEIGNLLRAQGDCGRAREVFRGVLANVEGRLPDDHNVLVGAREGVSACATSSGAPPGGSDGASGDERAKAPVLR